MIPAANLNHLMLRQGAIDEVVAGKFHIFAVETIDEGIEILTGLPAGGVTNKGSVNQKVERRLIEFVEQARAFHAGFGQP